MTDGQLLRRVELPLAAPVDPGRRAHRDRGRHRTRHDRRRHRRRRARRVHLPRRRDGRQPHHPGRRGAGRRCSRSPPTRCSGARRAPPAAAAMRRLAAAARCSCTLAGLRRRRRIGSSSARRTSPSSASWARSLAQTSSAARPPGRAAARPRRHVRLRRGSARRPDRPLRRVHGHGAHGDPEGAAPTPTRPQVLARVRGPTRAAGLVWTPAARLRQHVRAGHARRRRRRPARSPTPSRRARSWRAGFGYEFLERADGYPALARAYGLRVRRDVRTMDLGLLYRALAERQVDVVVGNATDGLIAALGLVVLDGRPARLPALRGRARRPTGGAGPVSRARPDACRTWRPVQRRHHAPAEPGGGRGPPRAGRGGSRVPGDPVLNRY